MSLNSLQEQVQRYNTKSPGAVYFDQPTQAPPPYQFKKKFANPPGFTFKTVSQDGKRPRPKYVDQTTASPTTTTTTPKPRYRSEESPKPPPSTTSASKYAYSDKYTYFTTNRPSTSPTTGLPRYTYSLNPSTPPPRKYTFRFPDNDEDDIASDIDKEEQEPVTDIPRFTYAIRDETIKQYNYVIRTTTPKPIQTTKSTEAVRQYTYALPEVESQSPRVSYSLCLSRIMTLMTSDCRLMATRQPLQDLLRHLQ